MSDAEILAGLPAMLDDFPALVARTDRQGRVMAANRRWRGQFENVTVGRDVATRLDSSSQQRWAQCLAAIGPTGQIIELVVQTRHGPVLANLFVWPEPSPGEGLWLVENPASIEGFRYLAETSAVISELATLHRVLALEKRRVESALQREQAAHEVAEAAVREWDQLLAFVAHDLKSPLTAIDLRAQYLLAQLPDSEPQAICRQGLSAIRESVHRMSHLIADLLDRAAVSAGRLTLRRQPLEIEPLVRRVLTELGPKASDREVRLMAELPPGLPLIDGDADRLQRVLVNLIDNAIRVSQPLSTVTVKAAAGLGNVHVSVQDAGPGLDEEAMAKLFRPFAQVTPKQATGSTGLGLSICKLIVEAHGGTLSAGCHPGSGCVFTFDVPVVTDREERRSA